jgi:Fe2+ transport system protein FeoA
MGFHGRMASPPAHPAAVPLQALPTGRSARVLDVPAGAVGALAAEGLTPGTIVEIETRQPLGGPVVIRIGRARLALSLRIARGILVEPWTPDRSTR